MQSILKLLSLATLYITLMLPAAHASSYLQHPAFKKLLEELQQQGFAEQELTEIFQHVEKQQWVLDAMEKAPERTKSWAEYRPIFYTEKRIQRGVKFWQDHQAVIERAAKKYGVPESIIVAIIGVETYYGRHKGKVKVLNSLATLAFDYPPRSRFFRSELVHFLRLTKEAGLNPTETKGSYAGAMGYPQFISSSYRHYSVDFDQDGRADLINSPADAIGSVANYFKRHHWRAGEPVVAKADNVGDTDLGEWVNRGLKPYTTVGELKRRGLVPRATLDDDMQATAWRVEGDNGIEYWVGLHNFYVITRYNHSHMYAMAVHELSQALQQHHQAKPD